MLVTAVRLLPPLVFFRKRSAFVTAPAVRASIRSAACELLWSSAILVGTITGPIRPANERLWNRFTVNAGAESKPELPILEEHSPLAVSELDASTSWHAGLAISLVSAKSVACLWSSSSRNSQRQLITLLHAQGGSMKSSMTDTERSSSPSGAKSTRVHPQRLRLDRALLQHSKRSS